MGINIILTPAKVIESLNSLLTPKDTEEDYYFEIPQNIYEPRVKKDFLFIGTCVLEKMENLSPAFLNSFTVINLDDQLEGASKKKKKKQLNI